jgi:CheY-like chemotaxis protein
MKTILILDENQYIRDTLAANLPRYLKECSILTGPDGEQGGRLLKTVPIDLVLTDLDMPVVDGFRFIERARKNHPYVRLCAMTGNCTPQLRQRLRMMGISGIIEKPFQFETLARMIARELASKS